MPIEQWNAMIEEAERAVEEEKQAKLEEEARKYHPVDVEGNAGSAFPEDPVMGQTFTRTDFEPPREFTYNGSQWVVAETRIKPDFTEIVDLDRPGDYLTDTESKKKSYMTKDQTGKMQIGTVD